MLFEESPACEVEGHLRNTINKKGDSEFEFFWRQMIVFSSDQVFLSLFCFLWLGLFWLGLFVFPLLSLLGFHLLSFNRLSLYLGSLSLFPSDLHLRNDCLSLRINFIHLFFGLHAFGDLVYGPVNYINEAFKRVLIEGVNLW